MYYHICSELHLDFLNSPSSWLFLLSLVVFKAVAEGKRWLSHWVSAASPSFCVTSFLGAALSHQVKPRREAALLFYLGNKVLLHYPGERRGRGRGSHPSVSRRAPIVTGVACALSGVPTCRWGRARQPSILGEPAEHLDPERKHSWGLAGGNVTCKSLSSRGRVVVSVCGARVL